MASVHDGSGRHEWVFRFFCMPGDAGSGYLDQDGWPHAVYVPWVGTETEADAEGARRLECYWRRAGLVSRSGFRVVPASVCGNMKHRVRG